MLGDTSWVVAGGGGHPAPIKNAFGLFGVDALQIS